MYINKYMTERMLECTTDVKGPLSLLVALR